MANKPAFKSVAVGLWMELKTDGVPSDCERLVAA